MTLDLGLRFDNDTVTGTTHVAPRAGFILVLTNDGKTLLKGGMGMFYDRVPLMYPVFEHMPERTVSTLDENGEVSSAAEYVNRIGGGLHNPESIAWNTAIERQVLARLTVRLAYEQRNTSKDFTISPFLTKFRARCFRIRGAIAYREYQVAGRCPVSASL